MISLDEPRETYDLLLRGRMARLLRAADDADDVGLMLIIMMVDGLLDEVEERPPRVMN